jgi:voltage-gated potassium channel
MNVIVILFFRRMFSRITKGPVLRLAIISVVLLLLTGIGVSMLERDLSFADSMWWSLVTVTTVGYGDITPQTWGGKVLGAVLMLFGIGFIALFTGTIAGAIVEGKSKTERGLKAVNVKAHICLCGWSHEALEIIEEFRADLKTKHKPIVLVANLPECPVQDDNIFFVRGDVTPEILKMANIEEAEVAIVLGDEGIEAYSRDARAILNVLTIKTINPELYVCIEIADRANYDHCLRAKADEIVVSGELCSSLLVQAAVDHGMTRVISELVSNRYGSELYRMKAPASIIGHTYVDALARLKEEFNVTLVAVGSPKGEDFEINPPADYPIREGETLVVVGEDRPGEIE